MNEYRSGGDAEVPEEIVCVDCGGTCHLLTAPPRDLDGHALPFPPGAILAYRCSDCLDRWDLEMP